MRSAWLKILTPNNNYGCSYRSSGKRSRESERQHYADDSDELNGGHWESYEVPWEVPATGHPRDQAPCAKCGNPDRAYQWCQLCKPKGMFQRNRAAEMRRTTTQWRWCPYDSNRDGDCYRKAHKTSSTAVASHQGGHAAQEKAICI